MATTPSWLQSASPSVARVQDTDPSFNSLSYARRAQEGMVPPPSHHLKVVSSLRSTSQFCIAGVSRVAISIAVSDKSRTNCRCF